MDDSIGGTLLWNSHEAYLFSAWSGMGYHSSAAGTLVALIPAYFGVSRRPDDARHGTVVFRITAAGVERCLVPNVVFRAYIPRDKTI